MTKNTLLLEEFLPYKLSYLTNLISSDLAKLYTEKFGIAHTEWRVMAVLGVSSGVSAGLVAEKTAMDKVAVSRAINNMIKNGLVTRCFSDDDKRRSELALSEKGQETYKAIVPMVLKYENEILQSLSKNEQEQLTNILTKLTGYIREK
ncbi:MarR family winged helix-turn-helix transcriptional regulator [Pseudemcibacter aquimaris]|uniref:MarR family winged helix-turn-helix transcriptional regulator n=1 Tax=Pseudemcibacter aquimaris TaxID=2857064 RepID=UPI002011AB1E|nr:MarR family winged helix-turn-helix transcriptional regulator [Pseudemcibacter aquimaris]MCC3862001.1 MarR family winged helix-turn-helix transcriptional regulator [Pseudemcibacter aquimaris]WDU58753.1 MarR family winged helix-turn-helix transcriptional regulator [Pseudemcibacter aquimaris]